MNIIQLTDLHLCDNNGLAFLHADAAIALHETVDFLLRIPATVDVLVISGDVSNDGSMSAYETVKKELSRLPWPVYFVPGNHDNKENMKAAGLIPADESSDCRVVSMAAADLILFDSAVPGKSHGRATSSQLQTLKKCLDDKKPQFLFMHHVPFVTGYTVMDETFEGVTELLDVVRGRDNLQVCCGHIHASMSTRINQVNMITCSPLCMAMEFDLTPQGGDMFYTSEPQFALFHVEGQRVITHFVTVPTGENRKGPFTFSI